MLPFLVHFGHLSLPTFGVLAAVGLLVGLGLSERTAGRAGVPAEKLWDAGLFAVIAAFVLSRVLLVVGNLKTFAAYPLLLLAVPSLTATGVLLTGVATFLWLRWKGVDVGRAVEAWAPCATVVWGFLALGHFAEGSDAGMATGLPWGVRMAGGACGAASGGVICGCGGVGAVGFRIPAGGQGGCGGTGAGGGGGGAVFDQLREAAGGGDDCGVGCTGVGGGGDDGGGWGGLGDGPKPGFTGLKECFTFRCGEIGLTPKLFMPKLDLYPLRS